MSMWLARAQEMVLAGRCWAVAGHDVAPHHAIVTASDSGIGRAAAVALAASGLDVGVTWHTDQDGAGHSC